MIKVLNGAPYIQPCRHIPADGNEWGTPIADTYKQVSRDLPLAGREALAPASDGAPRLIKQLREEAPWMEVAITRIAGRLELGAWIGRPWLALRPMLLVGPAGSGKSHFARRLGELSGCGSAILSFAGTRCDSELAGNPRGYRHQQASFPVCVMNRLETGNPVIVIDELEKTASGGLGDPVATLLTMLEPSTARRYHDGCLAAEVDISHVVWCLTANSIAGLPQPLLSRLDVIEVEGPGPEHAEHVISSVWQAVARDACLPVSALPPIEPEAELLLARLFRRTRSVRRVRRAVEQLLAVAARHGVRLIN